jgi:DNA repair protein RadD
MNLGLRPYQRAAINATYNFLEQRTDNPCIVLPVGSGKSVVMAGIVRELITEYKGLRIAVVAHVRELVRQNHEKLIVRWPEAPAGIYSASLNRRDRFDPVIFSSIQSVYNKAPMLGRFDLLLVDEAHRIPVKDEGTYRSFIQSCKRFNKDLRVVGLTATPYRLSGGLICEPENVLNAVSYEEPIADLIREGYLAKPISKGGAARVDLSDVHTRMGEYVEKDLERAMMEGDLVHRACKEIAEYCHNRRAWIVFASSVAHAQAISKSLTSLGFDGRVVVGSTPKGERDESIQLLSKGLIRYIVSVDVLSEGYDEPKIDAIILMRPTKSPGKYVQQVGRGTRPIYAPGFDMETREGRLSAIECGPKKNFLVLDFARNIEEHGPIDAIEIKKKRAGSKAELTKAPQKQCPKCNEFCAIQLMTCPTCEYEWPKPAPKHDDTATDAPILSDGEKKTHSHVVTGIGFAKYQKQGSPPLMKVTYSCGMRTFDEYVPLQFSGLPRSRAVEWWQARNYTRVPLVPRTVDEALDIVHTLRQPKTITVNESGKYPEIIGIEL